MKIAIAADGNKCSNHFGHCEGFKVYEIETQKIKDEYFINNPGHEPGFLPSYLADKDINVIIASSMGFSAQKLFKLKNIKVIVGASGKLENVIKRFINEELISDNSICTKHEFDENCSITNQRG